MGPVLQIHRYFDDINTHIHHMSSRGAIISSSGVTLEGISQITTIKKMVSEVVVASSDAFLENREESHKNKIL